MSESLFPVAGKTGLLIVDVQDRLLRAMPSEAQARVAKASVALIEMARLFDIPVVYTEQYPKGLGTTVEPVLEALSQAARFEKLEFSACANEQFAEAAELPRDVILAGIETHVCVLQTAVDLMDSGHRVFVARDAVASRSDENWRNGLSLMEGAGAVITNSETIIFRFLGSARGEAFKRLSKLVK